MPPYNRLFNWYVTQKNYLASGRGHTYFIYDLGKTALMGIGFLKLMEIELPYWIAILISIGVLMFYWTAGFIWDKYKGFNVEAEWGNQRNPLAKEIREKLK